MKYKISITQQAEIDLQKIHYYILMCLSNKKSADKIINKITKKILSLEQMPNRHPFYGKETHIRYLPVFKYIIFYYVENNYVYIIRIMNDKSKK